jgi:predicted alpha/beta superfamily hydrolase
MSSTKMNRSGIDRTYRTKPDRESTSIGGSSQGGLIAMHACLEEPEAFGISIK